MAGMKSVFNDLPQKDRRALARLFEMPEYESLKKAIELLRVNAGKAALLSMAWDDVKHLQGQAHGLKMLHKNLKDLNTQDHED